MYKHNLSNEKDKIAADKPTSPSNYSTPYKSLAHCTRSLESSHTNIKAQLPFIIFLPKQHTQFFIPRIGTDLINSRSTLIFFHHSAISCAFALTLSHSVRWTIVFGAGVVLLWSLFTVGQCSYLYAIVYHRAMLFIPAVSTNETVAFS